MAYVTTNPPALAEGAFAGVGNKWRYISADIAATVAAASYFTNGGSLGMKVGDLVFVHDTATPKITSHLVLTVSATYPGAVDLGDGTVIGTNTNS